MIIPEEYGGSEFGYLSMGLILEELGRTLTASPLLSSALAAASALILGGSDAQKSIGRCRSPKGGARLSRNLLEDIVDLIVFVRHHWDSILLIMKERARLRSLRTVPSGTPRTPAISATVRSPA